jgi:hypothetical protein
MISTPFIKKNKKYSIFFHLLISLIALDIPFLFSQDVQRQNVFEEKIRKQK